MTHLFSSDFGRICFLLCTAVIFCTLGACRQEPASPRVNSEWPIWSHNRRTVDIGNYGKWRFWTSGQLAEPWKGVNAYLCPIENGIDLSLGSIPFKKAIVTLRQGGAPVRVKEYARDNVYIGCYEENFCVIVFNDIFGTAQTNGKPPPIETGKYTFDISLDGDKARTVENCVIEFADFID